VVRAEVARRSVG